MSAIFRLFLLVNIALPMLASCADEGAPAAARDAAPPLHDAVVHAFKKESGPPDAPLLAKQGPAGQFIKQTTILGLKRGYLLYVPTSVAAGSAPAPVLVALHGAGDTADNFAGWKDIKLTVVQGAPHSWLWRPVFGQSNKDLWDWLEKNGK